MSQLSELIHKWFGDPDKQKTVEEIIKEHLGGNYETVVNFAGTMILAMEGADDNHDGYLDKRETVKMAVRGLATALGVKIPSWVLNLLIEKLVAQIKIGEFKIPVPGINQYPEPEAKP